MDAESILKEFKGIKGEGARDIMEADTSLGTFKATVVGIEYPKTQRYASQGHYQWIVKTKVANHGDTTINHWLTVNINKKMESASFFSGIAVKLQKATGTAVTNTKMELDESIAAINALAGKELMVTQGFDGKKYSHTYAPIA